MARGYEAPSPLPPDSKADRRELGAALIAFVLGFFGLLAGFVWVIVRFVATPETRWWDFLHTIIICIWVSFIGALALALGVVSLLSRWHFRRGVYRCPYCDRPLKGINRFCECPDVQALKAEHDESIRRSQAGCELCE